MKVIHKISPVLILAGYFYILYEGYFLCQFGGVRYHGQKMAVGAAVMAVGFLIWPLKFPVRTAATNGWNLSMNKSILN